MKKFDEFVKKAKEESPKDEEMMDAMAESIKETMARLGVKDIEFRGREEEEAE